ncbi:MAG: hypothetical protein HKN22_00225, partial [Bacteroidia bacterium]|nr:hypothetical protein [Bacteroidia bacterium]
MRNLIFTLCLILVGFTVQAQTNVFHENFEWNSMPDSVTSTGTPGWVGDSTLFSSGARSITSNVLVGDTMTLTTNTFNTTGNFLVLLVFDHICKIEFFDFAIVEVSANGGASWTQLDSTHYEGASPNFGAGGNRFNESSYVTWQFGQNNPPQNTWWKKDTFNVSNLIPNTANAMVRFRLFDGNFANNPNKAGWYIDDINIIAAFSEIDPPKIVQQNPILQNTVYNLGPYTLRANITDASGIASANLHYTVNSGPDNIV